MAQGDKKKSNGGGRPASGKKGGASEKARAEEAKPAKKAVAKEEPEAAAEAREAEAPEKEEKAAKVEKKVAHGHDHGHKPGAHAGHAPNIKEYFVIFGVLFALTVLEVVVAQIPGIGKTSMAIALIGLALTKAACVGLYYMHLKHETKFLRLVVAFPMVFPTIYALVLIGDAAWRLTR